MDLTWAVIVLIGQFILMVVVDSSVHDDSAIQSVDHRVHKGRRSRYRSSDSDSQDFTHIRQRRDADPDWDDWGSHSWSNWHDWDPVWHDWDTNWHDWDTNFDNWSSWSDDFASSAHTTFNVLFLIPVFLIFIIVVIGVIIAWRARSCCFRNARPITARTVTTTVASQGPVTRHPPPENVPLQPNIAMNQPYQPYPQYQSQGYPIPPPEQQPLNPPPPMGPPGQVPYPPTYPSNQGQYYPQNQGGYPPAGPTQPYPPAGPQPPPTVPPDAVPPPSYDAVVNMTENKQGAPHEPSAPPP